MESDSLPFKHGMEHEAFISESYVYANSFDYGEMSPMCVYEEPGSCTVPSQYMCSSTYDYTNDIDNFMSKKGDAYQCCDRDQPREELRPSYSSSEPESIHLDSESEHSQDSELESGGSVHGNPPFGSKSHVAPDFEPSSDLCTSYRVISNSSALSQLEGKKGVAQVDEAHCTATPVLNDSTTHPLSIDITSHDLEYGAVEALVDWNLKESSTLSEFTKTPSASPYLEESAPTLVMSTVPFRPSYESTSLSPPSSLVPETSHSSYGMPDHSPTKESSAMRHLEAKELRYSLVSLEYESPIESELESLTAQSIPRISWIQSNYSSPMSALGSSFESDHLFHAGNRPQRPSVHSARTKNMEIIHASLRRSNLNFDEGVERCALDDVYVHTEEADPSTTQDSSRALCDTTIRHVQKRELGHLIRIFEWKPVPAYSYDFIVMHSTLTPIRIAHPIHSMVLDSGFDLNDDTILQAPEIAPRNESFDDFSRLLAAPDLDEGIGCSIHTGDQSTMRHSEVQESERSLVMSKSESAVESELELLSIPCISQISLVQSNHPNPMSALSAFFALDRLYLAVNKSQCMPVHSVRMLNLMTIRTSLRKSHLEFSDGAERRAMYDAYGYAEEATPSILPVSSKDLSNISIQRVPKRDSRCLMRIFKLKHALASSYRFSATTSVPWTSTIKSSSHSMVLGSGFDLDIENMSQVQELALLHEGSNDSRTVMSIAVLDTNFECINWSFSTDVETQRFPEDLGSYANFRAMVSVFIQLLPSSQGEHVDYILGILLSMLVWRNGT